MVEKYVVGDARVKTIDGDGIVAGKPKRYFHEKHLIIDSKGNKCVIRCSFDEDRFFLRSASFIKEGKSFRGNPIDIQNNIKSINVSNVKAEFCEEF